MISEDIEYDIKVGNAFKRYGETSVINGLNMNVMSGSIYGILGPSGCGKTTLLQCILGNIPLDSGCIDLEANLLNEIGYMPQDICLNETLTIKEIFEFYGTLNNMNNREIQSRIDDLNEFLKFPDLNSYINKISGEQSKRVSLAISILHNPKIIILDEPTVGIDPVQRQEIWEEFVNMVTDYKKTIVITTHYFEEAKLADCIGLMRNGILVEEGSPQDFLTKYNSQSLEECYLKACYNQDIQEINQNKIRVISNPQSNNLIRFDNNLSFRRIKALFKKNVRVTLRDHVLFYTMIILPILMSIVFCCSIGRKIKNMPITYKNDEINFLDCQYSNTNGCIFDENNNQTMSCVVLKYLESHDYNLVEVKDQEDGNMGINTPNDMAFLYFPNNFTKDLTTYINNRENYENLAYARIARENLVITSQIKMDIFNSIYYLLNRILNGCFYNPKLFSIPMRLNTVYGHELKEYGNSFVSKFILLNTFYFSSIFSSSIMMTEKMDGTLSRSMFSGVKVLELLISMFFINMITTFIQMVTTNLIVFVIFSNTIQISTGLFVYMVIMILMGFIGFLFGLIAAVLSSTKKCGIYIVMAMFNVQIYIGGGVWPIEGQPNLLRKLSELFPLRVLGQTVDGIVLKGWTLHHPSILFGTTASFACAILIVLVLIILGKYKKDLWVIHK